MRRDGKKRKSVGDNEVINGVRANKMLDRKKTRSLTHRSVEVILRSGECTSGYDRTTTRETPMEAMRKVREMLMMTPETAGGSMLRIRVKSELE